MNTFYNSSGNIIMNHIFEIIVLNLTDRKNEKNTKFEYQYNLSAVLAKCRKHMKEEPFTFADGLYRMGTLLLNEIITPWGPIYGTFLLDMANCGEYYSNISARELRNMLVNGYQGMIEVADEEADIKAISKVLDKIIEILTCAIEQQRPFDEVLEQAVDFISKTQNKNFMDILLIAIMEGINSATHDCRKKVLT